MTKEELERIKDIDSDIYQIENFLEKLPKMQGVDCLSCTNYIAGEYDSTYHIQMTLDRYEKIENDVPCCLHSELSDIIKDNARKLAESKLSELKQEFEQIKINK